MTAVAVPDSPVEPYKGSDRRGTASGQAKSMGRPFVVSGTLLLIIWLLLARMATMADAERLFGLTEMTRQFGLALAALATVVGVLCVLRWRLAGDAPALWVGVGVIVFGVFTIGLGESFPLVAVDGLETSVLGWVRPASLLVTLALLSYAAVSPQVDARLRPWPLLVLAIGAVTAVTVILQLLPGVTAFVIGAADVVPGVSPRAGGPAVMIVVWAALSSAYIWRGIRRGSLFFAYFGLMLFSLTFAEVSRVLTTQVGAAWVYGYMVLQAVALLFGLTGVSRAVQQAFGEQSSRLLHTTVSRLASEARMRAEQAAQQERAHEARNALAAIEGATLTLERHRDLLEDDTRSALASAVSGEIARLQRLVAADLPAADFRIAYRVADVVGPQVALARAQGAHILTDVPGKLIAVGRPADTAEVLQNLLINALRHGNGSSIVVRAAAEDGRVVVRVEDRGPGVPASQRKTIFQRGGRGSTQASGSGLGLYVSAQLMRDQDGELWVEDRPGGGACFVLAVPAAALSATRGAENHPSFGPTKASSRHESADSRVP